MRLTMAVGLIGRKVGMTRIFTEEGVSIPVTVIEATPNRVTQVKSQEVDGYNAIQVTMGSVKKTRVNTPVAGHYTKAGVQPGLGLWEFNLDDEDNQKTVTNTDFVVGSELTVNLFVEGQEVDVAGVSKGKGFAGVIKRYHFTMGDATHGNSLSHRSPGSIGQRQSPGRVFKGKKMAGRMGNSNCTVQTQTLVRVDEKNNLLFVKGGIPGAPGGIVEFSLLLKLRIKGAIIMQVNMISLDNNISPSALSISDQVFGRDFNEALIHQVVVAYRAAGRAGTRAQKTRSEVRGSNAKPWKQKGLGRARSGTKQSPIWRTGGVTFAARPANHAQKVNKKMYRGAICSILSELLRKERLIVVDSFSLETPKTKDLIEKLNPLNINDVLIITRSLEDNLYFASRNLYKISVCDVIAVDPVSLIGHSYVLVTADALQQLEEMLA